MLDNLLWILTACLAFYVIRLAYKVAVLILDGVTFICREIWKELTKGTPR